MEKDMKKINYLRSLDGDHKSFTKLYRKNTHQSTNLAVT